MRKLMVNTRRLNLRNAPSTDSQVIAVLKNKERVEIQKFAANLYWVLVKRENGQTGWASYKYFLGLPPEEYYRANDPVWLKIAFGEFGVTELRDPGENARIAQYLKSCEESLAAINENSDETAWCSAFVNWVMEKAGYAGTDSAWALSWKNWGRNSQAVRGSIAVFKRFVRQNDGVKTFGHVGFYLGKDPQDNNRVLILGGNQKNKVKISSYPIRSNSYELISFKRPALISG